MKSIIRTIAAAAALLLCGGAASAAFETTEASRFAPGGRNLVAPDVTTPEGTTAMQFTMTLPEGFSLYSTTVTLTKSRISGHTYKLNKTGDRTYKCVIYSASNAPFASTSGSLFSFNIKADANAERGDYPLEFTEIFTSDAAGVETPMEDATVVLPVRIRPTGITISPTSAEIFVGEVIKFNGIITPAEADQEITWDIHTFSTTCASIDETGLVKGLEEGSAMVYAICTQNPTISAVATLEVKPILPASVTLSQSTLELRKGESADITATVLPENAANKNVEWSTSNSSCVYVNSDGRITARGIGTATVTATASANSEAKASCTVTVLPPLTTSLTMNRTSLNLTMGETAALSVRVSPSDAQPNPEWTSSDPAVAYVDAEGNVTALNAGTATITAAATDGSGLSATARVTVVRPQGTSVSLDKTEVSLRIDQTATVTASVVPATASADFSWSSSNASVATVAANENTASAVITAKSAGSAIIKATTTDGSNRSASLVVTVSPALAVSVTLDKTSLSMAVGDADRLTATVLPQTASGAVDWSSSAPAIVSVDAEGNVRALALGNAVVTATATDGSGKSASCAVSVDRAYVTQIVLDRTELSLSQSSAPVKVNATVLPDYATNKTLEWTSTNPAVATVDATGTVTPAGLGSTTIRVRATDGSDVEAELAVSVVADVASSISILPSTADIEIGATVIMTAQILPATASQSVNWRSSNSAVATVSANGTVTALAEGTATITATTTDGTNLSATSTVTVRRPAVSSVTLDKTSVSLAVGEGTKLSATVLPAAAEASVTWSSSAPTVATVDNDGNVRALALGNAVVTATATDGSGKSASCAVSVDRAYVTQIVLDRTELRLSQSSAPVKVNATVLPDYATNKTLEWTSTNPAVATVDATGTVTPAGLGSTTIRVRATDGSDVEAELAVSVVADVATSISIMPPAVTLDITQTTTLVATIQPATASQSVVWTSANAEVATVDADGTVTALAEGTAVIIATTTDGTNLTAMSTVIVRPAKVTSITLDPESIELIKGATLKIEAEVLPEYASNPVLQWMSTNPAIATVDGTGLVTACGKGEATITAIATDGSGITATCLVTVMEEDAIEEISIDSIGEAQVYDLMGRRISKPGRGLYIVNGKLLRLR